jgi:hypothetical protein
MVMVLLLRGAGMTQGKKKPQVIESLGACSGEGVVHIMVCRPHQTSLFGDLKLAIPPEIPPDQSGRPS